MIILQNVIKSFGKHIVLNDINFSIQGQEFVSITGPSGAGKTTIINMLIGADKPDSGIVSVDGYEINKMARSVLQEYRRKIGIIFQDYKLLPYKTAYENIAFAMEVCGFSDKEIKTKVHQLLEIVGLEKHSRHFPRQLSGGENQRVALARALIHSPKLILADEPTGNLDHENAIAMIKLLLAINEQGVTVLLATHDREIVNMINRRVIRVQDGKIVADIEQGGYDLGAGTIYKKEEIREIHIY